MKIKQLFSCANNSQVILSLAILFLTATSFNILTFPTVDSVAKFIHLLILIYAACVIHYVIFCLYRQSRILWAVVTLLIFTLNALIFYAVKYFQIAVNYNLIFDILGNSKAELLQYSTIINIGFIPYLLTLVLIPFAILNFLLKRQYIYYYYSKVSFTWLLLLSLLCGSAAHLLYESKYYEAQRSNIKLITARFSPNNYIIASFRFYQKNRRVMKTNLPEIASDARLENTDKLKTVILVVGESARSDHFSLNGYVRDTNPQLSKIQNLFSFSHMESCSTSTWHSVPCIFSSKNADSFSLPVDRKNVLDLLTRLGLEVYWLSSQGSCITTCDNVINKKISLSGDKEILNELEIVINEKQTQDRLIVLHHQGSHYPYYTNFKPRHALFTPFCKENDFIHLCSQKEVVNAYDNTLIATDEFIAKIIGIADAQQDSNTMLIFTSDHGQSLGENGTFAHNKPKIIAPLEQLHVPLILWLSDNITKSLNIDHQSLNNIAKNEHFSHDNIFSSILGIFNVKTQAYNPALDLLSTEIAAP